MCIYMYYRTQSVCGFICSWVGAHCACICLPSFISLSNRKGTKDRTLCFSLSMMLNLLCFQMIDLLHFLEALINRIVCLIESVCENITFVYYNYDFSVPKFHVSYKMPPQWLVVHNLKPFASPLSGDYHTQLQFFEELADFIILGVLINKTEKNWKYTEPVKHLWMAVSLSWSLREVQPYFALENSFPLKP